MVKLEDGTGSMHSGVRVKMAKQISRPKPPSRVYRDLSGTKIQDLTVEAYTNLVSESYIEQSNVEFLSDLARVISFQEKPKGLQLVKAVQSGVVNSSSWVTLLEIPAGKTYDIQVVCAISTTGDSTISYALDAIDFSGTEYLLKNQTFDGTDGVSVDFSTQGDFLLSGLSTQSTYLKAKRSSGTGSVGGHNVFYREVN